ncbi:HlyC/CorC family transporter [bacterium]|nr:HlyC/CorC family transporter [bacterium]
MKDVILIISLLLLLLLSAFFSGSEIAYASCNKIRLKNNAEKKVRNAVLAYRISNDFPTMISAILLGNNLVNIAASSIATLLFAAYYGPKLGPTLAVIVMTVLILLLGEILPKLFAKRKANALVYILAKPLRFFCIIFKPLAWVVTKLVELISPLWSSKEKIPSVTDEELVNIVETIEDEGVIDEHKSDLIISAIRFSDVDAYEIMVPRVDVVALDIEDALEKLVPNSEYLNYSYLPIYEGTIDNILGIISTKEIMRLLIKKEAIDVKALLIEPLYVHRTKAIDELIKEMNSSKILMTIVVDESGGFDGIVTSEEILEGLVGEIWDEKDKVELEYIEKEEGIYIVDGDMNIYDFFELVGLNSYDFSSEYATVGGWVTEVLERFPAEKDQFEYKNLLITVLAVDDVRVEKIRAEVKSENNQNKEE